MQNLLLISQIKTMILNLNNFLKGCEIAAIKDDGKVSKEEQRQLDQIRKATDKYIKELNKILNK